MQIVKIHGFGRVAFYWPSEKDKARKRDNAD